MGFCDEHLAGCYVSFTVIAQACLKVFLNFILNVSGRAQSKSVYSYCLTWNCACSCCLWFEWLLAQCPAHYWYSEALIYPISVWLTSPSAHPVRSICLSAIISSVSIYSVVVLNLTIQKNKIKKMIKKKITNHIQSSDFFFSSPHAATLDCFFFFPSWEHSDGK